MYLKVAKKKKSETNNLTLGKERLAGKSWALGEGKTKQKKTNSLGEAKARCAVDHELPQNYERMDRTEVTIKTGGADDACLL